MSSLAALSRRYPLWLCDVWGVIHNGHDVFASACDALSRHIGNGGISLLLTNSPRSCQGVARQLRELGVPDESYSAIVTSGDVTQELMRRHARGLVYHLGPTRDMSIFEGQQVERVGLDAAHAVLCTGLVNDVEETPADYAQLLAGMKARGLPMICANPDKLVRKGDRLLYCAGALGDAYAAIGGEVLMAGKPFAPVYDLALETASTLAGRRFDRDDVLAIGDGPETDLKGAADYGVPAILIAGGVMEKGLSPAAAQARVMQAYPALRIELALPELAWS
jgi:HAD superfamily hydrolase (TIGR01459 family)